MHYICIDFVQGTIHTKAYGNKSRKSIIRLISVRDSLTTANQRSRPTYNGQSPPCLESILGESEHGFHSRQCTHCMVAAL